MSISVCLGFTFCLLVYSLVCKLFLFFFFFWCVLRNSLLTTFSRLSQMVQKLLSPFACTPRLPPQLESCPVPSRLPAFPPSAARGLPASPAGSALSSRRVGGEGAGTTGPGVRGRHRLQPGRGGPWERAEAQPRPQAPAPLGPEERGWPTASV